jgi:hypothetical protein
VCRARNRAFAARLWDAATGAALATLEGHKSFVVAVAFSPDDKRALEWLRGQLACLMAKDQSDAL